jgi:hypothetical protein
MSATSTSVGGCKAYPRNKAGFRVRNLKLLLLLLLLLLFTPWSKVLLEKLTVNFAASQEISRIYGTRKFLTVPTSARHLSLSWANSIQSPRPPAQRSEEPSSYYPPIYVLVSPMASFSQASPPCTHLYPPPYAPHDLPISFVSLKKLTLVEKFVYLKL